MRQNVLGVLAGVAATSIWGGLYVVSDVVLEVIPPFTLLALRLLIGLPVVGALLGFFLLDEVLSTSFFVGGVLILLGVALVSLTERQGTLAQTETAPYP